MNSHYSICQNLQDLTDVKPFELHICEIDNCIIPNF